MDKINLNKEQKLVVDSFYKVKTKKDINNFVEDLFSPEETLDLAQRLNLEFWSGMMRSLSSLAVIFSTVGSLSPIPKPTKTKKPGPIWPVIWESTVTLAEETRWMIKRMGLVYMSLLAFWSNCRYYSKKLALPHIFKHSEPSVHY